MKLKSKQKRPLIQIIKSLHKVQLISLIAVFLLLTGTVSAATVVKVNNERAKKEQERVLRTANLESVNSAIDSNDKPTAENTHKIEENKTSTSISSTAPRKTQTVTFTKGGASLQGSTVSASFTASADLSGTCYFTFILGNSQVTQNSKSSGRTCAISLPLSSFAKSGNWILSLKYVSTDNYTQGSIGNIEVSIVPEVRTISFTKGGAGKNIDVISANGYLSESQSGICTFTFSLNGTVRVNKTVTISNSNKCSIDIPISEFPKSAIYSYTLSFISNDTLTIANQSAFDVEVF